MRAIESTQREGQNVTDVSEEPLTRSIDNFIQEAPAQPMSMQIIQNKNQQIVQQNNFSFKCDKCGSKDYVK